MFSQRNARGGDYVIHVRLGDSIDIHCPQVSQHNHRTKQPEYYKLYQVIMMVAAHNASKPPPTTIKSAHNPIKSVY